jgi:hypothetical protein
VSVELRFTSASASESGEQPLVLAFDHRCGWLLAGLLDPGWLARLDAAQRQTLASALAGLYKLAGVHLTRERIAASLPATVFAFGITNANLVVWSPDGGQDVMYDLSAGPALSPLPLESSVPAGMPTLDANGFLFINLSLTWQNWVRSCDGEQSDNPVFEAHVLPAP